MIGTTEKQDGPLDEGTPTENRDERDGDALLVPQRAAGMLGVSKNTLANWRVDGRGPRYIKLGASRTSAIRYKRSDIEAYIALMTRSSTADPGPGDD